ncbi:hypothetical protein [Halosegnis sp.]|uniref:hypothetical protein n=1 Tax=Halosegnis sp. TaxID=2864959 RepID=UPI0035D4A7D3
MTEPNVVARAAVERGVVECPLCGRQLVDVAAALVTFGPSEATPSTADAVECPVCEGVCFIDD